VNKRAIKHALDSLAERDTHVAEMLPKVGYPAPRIHPPGFETFLSTIIGQQISVAAAASIKRRVHAVLPEVSAQGLHATDGQMLRDAGLSQRKLEYAKGLAEAIVAGRFDPQVLERMDNAEAIEHIVQLRGFGIWSAEIYLMFSLGREDIFPADDLIIRVGLQTLKRKRRQPTAKEARVLVKRWAPFRSAGSLFLWHLHHKGLTKAVSKKVTKKAKKN